MVRRVSVFILAAAFVLNASPVFVQGVEDAQPNNEEVTFKEAARIKARINELTRKLELTPRQQAMVKEILTESRDDIKGVLKEAQAKVKEFRVKAHDEIAALLTDQQNKKFQKLRKKHEASLKIEE